MNLELLLAKQEYEKRELAVKHIQERLTYRLGSDHPPTAKARTEYFEALKLAERYRDSALTQYLALGGVVNV